MSPESVTQAARPTALQQAIAADNIAIAILRFIFFSFCGAIKKACLQPKTRPAKVSPIVTTQTSGHRKKEIQYAYCTNDQKDSVCVVISVCHGRRKNAGGKSLFRRTIVKFIITILYIFVNMRTKKRVRQFCGAPQICLRFLQKSPNKKLTLQGAFCYNN